MVLIVIDKFKVFLGAASFVAVTCTASALPQAADPFASNQPESVLNFIEKVAPHLILDAKSPLGTLVAQKPDILFELSEAKTPGLVGVDDLDDPGVQGLPPQYMGFPDRL